MTYRPKNPPREGHKIPWRESDLKFALAIAATPDQFVRRNVEYALSILQAAARPEYKKLKEYYDINFPPPEVL
jgi:hypothetical protein